MLYSYKGKTYPEYLKQGNATQYIVPIAEKFCIGDGVDIGSGKYPLPGAEPWELEEGRNAYDLPRTYDYIFSSHCLEHLFDPIKALTYWYSRIKPGGVLFLYLPHPEMEYWLPQNNKKHLHAWYPYDMKKILLDLGYEDVLISERDLFWSFCACGFTKTTT